MSEDDKNQNQMIVSESTDDESNMLNYWRVILKRGKLIGWIVMGITILTVVITFFMTNIYEAKAVITPAVGKDGGNSGGFSAILAQQFGGLPGIAMPGSSSATEIVNLLKSNILREKVIVRYNLLPVLFSKQWDAEKQRWKAKEGGFSLNPLALVSSLKQPGVPDIWDGLRALDSIVKVNRDIKENIITITAEYRDAKVAAKFVEYFMDTLTDHMSAEARRVAMTNMKYLQIQLEATADPFIKQKIYNMIAQQLETSMMAEVKENFAFKVIDPPMVPDRKIKPKRLQVAGIALIMSLLIGIFVAFFLEYLEKKNRH